VSPSSNRWRPRRAGIINLYEYANQVFDFAGGRLLLRGHNTSGKTKALELLLPYCLDGDINPKKLDPFGSTHKDMRWNLVGATDDEKRVGYVWLEFERLDERGAPERLTAGIGMRAHRDVSEVRRWYFHARGRTIGSDLELLRGREPIAKADLATALGDDGEVLDSQRDYRARLNDLLFGFGGEAQYQTMLRLMRDLRRPHLSKTLDPDRVAEQLTLGLPEVDDSLMRRLAGGLEQLETLERDLERLRDVRDRVRRFHQRTYSAYARAAVRERADAVRQAQTAVENAAEAVRATRTELEQQAARGERAGGRRESADADVVRLSAEEHALISSEAWSSVAEVEALRGHADTQRRAAEAARARAADAGATASALEAELITAEAAAAGQREAADAELESVVSLAEHAGVSQRLAVLAEQLRQGTMTADTWGSLVRELAGDWRDVLHRQRELLHELRRASDRAEQARAEERAAAIRVEQILARKAEAERQLEHARDAFAATFAEWRSELIELAVDDTVTATALELSDAGRSPAPALAAAADAVRSSLADERSDMTARRQTASEAIAAADAEIERLASARDDGPAPPAWTRTDRSHRAGAPLWRLIDFVDGLPAGQRSGIEAALETAGALDAWVTPTGKLADPTLADVVLSAAAEPASDPTLNTVLAPVAGRPVDERVIARLLQAIALGERESGPWIDVEGRFAFGPLAGRGAKSQAEHIGAAARQARRAARISDLRLQIAALEESIRDHDAQLARLDKRRGTLESELAALPAVDAVASAVDALRVVRALESEAGRTHAQATTAARAAAEEEIAADGRRREHAVHHKLVPSIDEAVLDGMRDAAAELGGASGATAGAWRLAEREAHAAATVATRLDRAQQSAAELDRAAGDEEAESQRMTAEHAAREAALGTTGEEIRRRHERATTQLRASRDLSRKLLEEEQTARLAAAKLEGDLEARTREHEGERSRREEASGAFGQVAHTGLLQLVLGDGVPDDVRQAASWTFSRTLEVARALPPDLLSVSRTTGEQGIEVQRGVQLLDRELAESDMGAYVSQDSGGLLLVRVTEGGAEQNLGQILEALGGEIADREQILSAEERRVFSDALVEEIADHLRHRVHEVHGRVDRMNRVLERSPTAAGKLVQLGWQPLEDDSGTQRAALGLLRRDVRHLRDEDRESLVGFFRGRIEAARREHVGAGEAKPMAETLMDAFDYRRWFAFRLYERLGRERVRLTRQRHAVGSGGEQSVLIHLPLFAAAAALYGDTAGPRLIMLDEALSGIDDETRERVLEATVAFDLDLVMTSHELWGTYRSVPQLAIYQLHRENGSFGVHAIPFIWDGDVLRELQQSELLV
jgi:uncharacterized protein (TIGR02680 family)